MALKLTLTKSVSDPTLSRKKPLCSTQDYMARTTSCEKPGYMARPTLLERPRSVPWSDSLYSVQRYRATKQMQYAIQTNDPEAKLRRLRQSLSIGRDLQSQLPIQELTVAKRERDELKTRLSTQYRTALKSAIASGDIQKIEAAIKDGLDIELGEDDLKPARDALKRQDTTLRTLHHAFLSGDIESLETAIQEAEKYPYGMLIGDELRKTRRALENVKKACAALKEAIKTKNIDPIEAAIKQAEGVQLSEKEPVFRKARRALKPLKNPKPKEPDPYERAKGKLLKAGLTFEHIHNFTFFVYLFWEDEVDVDLRVVTPDGQIDYRTKAKGAFKLELDDLGKEDGDHVENISSSTPIPFGPYRVEVFQAETLWDLVLFIKSGDDIIVREFEGNGNNKNVTSFDVGAFGVKFQEN